MLFTQIHKRIGLDSICEKSELRSRFRADITFEHSIIKLRRPTSICILFV